VIAEMCDEYAAVGLPVLRPVEVARAALSA
jgi:hypothetical protein